MILHKGFELPEDLEKKLSRTKKIQWISLGVYVLILGLMYSVLGQSQAMRTAWVEDMLGLIPPIGFLLALRWRERKPDVEFPYGYRRVTTISFLAASGALFVAGCILLFEALHKLAIREHPSIGVIEIFGEIIWLGWPMIAVLIFSSIPTVIFGHMKSKAGSELHERTLFADAQMNKADWLTAMGAVLGILGIGYGLWWADAAAAAFISLDTLKDGAVNIKTGVTDLMDRRPVTVDDRKPIEIIDKIVAEIEKLAWVKEADLRLREDGQVLTGELFIVPRQTEVKVTDIRDARNLVREIDWRIHDITVQIMKEFDDPKDDWIKV